MDAVFKAINDPSRRVLLDALFERDGRTLGELTELLPEMTRFGVMSHLRVLEEAGLITTRREGRSKLHFLNPVPIRLIHDRWISKYAEPRVGAVASIKARVEGGRAMSSPVHIYQVFIGGTPEAVWDALVDPDKTQQYFYGTRINTDLEPGSKMTYDAGDGSIVASGEIISADPPKRLEMTFTAHWDPGLEAEGPAREVWLIEEANGVTKLTVELYDVVEGDKRHTDYTNGFPFILSGLKTLVETGKPLAG